MAAIVHPLDALKRRTRHESIDTSKLSPDLGRARRKFERKCFIIFADLDGTFTPMDLSGKLDFVSIVREITKAGCQVKFVPISGRPSGYVLRVLHETRDMLKGEGLDDICEYGAAEQGALLVDASKSYGPKYTGAPEHTDLKGRVGKILANNVHHEIVTDEPDKLYTCSIHIKNEAKEFLTPDQMMDIYWSVRREIEAEYGVGTLSISMAHNCMEVMHKEISKAKAISTLAYRYMKLYNVVGMLMAGDAENDKIALDYMSHMAEIPGVRAHVFIPGNAQEAVESKALEQWKEKNKFASPHRILKDDAPLFKGITHLIRQELQRGTLFGTGPQMFFTRDDSEVPELYKQSNLNINIRTNGTIPEKAEIDKSNVALVNGRVTPPECPF